MADKTTGAKRIGRDTMRSMGLDPDKDYVEAAKSKASELAADAGVGMRNAGRLYGKSIGMDVSPYEKERGMKKGGSASSRADGIAQRGKTKGKMVMCGGGMARGKK